MRFDTKVLRRVALTVALVGCDPPDDGGTAEMAKPDPVRSAALRALDQQVIRPTYATFARSAVDLSAAVEAWAGDPEAQGEAQAAFRVAMLDWERAEVLQIGPAAPSIRPGGQGLRDEIYAWPSTNPCRIDQTLVSQDYAKPKFPDGQLVNVYGLDALEYLLFVDSVDNACPPQVPLNAEGSWAAIDAPELAQRRADYAAAVARRITADADRLASAWSAFSPDFVGDEREVYANDQAALDDVFAALFYVDFQLKDAKLAEPAGLGIDCAEDRCPDAVELRWSNLSTESVDANLTAVEQVLTVGFEPLLVAQSADELIASLKAHIADSRRAVVAIGPFMASAVEADPTSTRAAYTAVKAFTDLLKSQFVTVLNLSLPQEGAADND